MGDVFYDMSKLSEMKNVNDAAIEQITEEQMNDPELKDKGMAALMLPLLTLTFAAKMKRILFGKEE